MADPVRLNRGVKYSLLGNEATRASGPWAPCTSTRPGIPMPPPPQPPQLPLELLFRHKADDGRIRGRIDQTMEAAIAAVPGPSICSARARTPGGVLENGIGMLSAPPSDRQHCADISVRVAGSDFTTMPADLSGAGLPHLPPA